MLVYILIIYIVCHMKICTNFTKIILSIQFLVCSAFFNRFCDWNWHLVYYYISEMVTCIPTPKNKFCLSSILHISLGQILFSLFSICRCMSVSNTIYHLSFFNTSTLLMCFANDFSCCHISLVLLSYFWLSVAISKF